MRNGEAVDKAEVNHPQAGPVRRVFPRGQMISLKRYLDAVEDEPPEMIEGGTNTLPAGAAKRLEALIAPNARELLTVTVAAYRSALLETGKYSMEACPALGDGLNSGLQKLNDRLAGNVTREAVEGAERSVQEQLEDWGERTAKHYRQKTGEVKELLLVLARTAESVGSGTSVAHCSSVK